jgi:hypothetical protein
MGKHGFQYFFHPLRTETINDTEVWFLLPSEPHEHHIFANRLGDLRGRINARWV